MQWSCRPSWLLPLLLLVVCSVLNNGAHADEGKEIKHEAGRCSIRGQCGKQSIFGKALPCPDNGLAKDPDKDTRTKLVNICGDNWKDGPICCNEEQVDALGSNLKTARNFIGACPACKENFYNLFCTFTCSPDQSLFVNVTETAVSTSKKTIVTELDNLWSNSYGEAFYNSCKDVKFGASGGTAMEFIGGGAKNYTEFLKFLGDKKPFLGSPFQINFPRPKGREIDGMKAADPPSKLCNDTDVAYRCACVDCPALCPTLAPVAEQERCHVGLLPCLSFAAILVYSVLVLLVVTAVVGHVAYRKHAQRQSERLRLLHDSAPSDDEDEGYTVHNAGMLERQRNYRLNSFFDTVFSNLGMICARFPLVTISISVAVVGLLSLGWMNFDIETNPERLWVSPSSAAAKEKVFFDSNFGPFFRAEQAFLVNDTLQSGPGPVLSYDTLKWWLDVEKRVAQTTAGNITFEDVCFKPTGVCVVQSLSGYLQGSLDKKWADTIAYCSEHSGDSECLPEFGLPLKKDIVLGGWESTGNILQSSALVVTWVVNNYAEGSNEERDAIKWERNLEALLLNVTQEAKEKGLRLSFNTEMSLEQELNGSANTDAKIVVISYIIMFIYASLALGSASLSIKTVLRNPAIALIRSKFSLGVSGIVIVLMSVSASVGLFSAAGIKVTLIIAEVIPFLVLAVGVDNIFLIVHEFERVNQNHPDEAIETRVAKALGRMGPSILLSASTETIAFALGIFVGMPAVRNFAAYAAGAVFINALLQVTLFVSVLALNQRRVESSRVDCFPCVKIKGVDRGSGYGGIAFGSDTEGPLQKFIRKTYAPALLNRKVKVAIVLGFFGLFTAGLALIPEVKLGLDQRIAIPRTSYLIDYFDDLDAYFNTGPPVYFVTSNVNATNKFRQQELCGRFSTCERFSVANVLEQESKRSDVSYITGATANWLDDFLFWLQPSQDNCCKEHGKVCFENRLPAWNLTLYGMPEGEEFMHYLTKWLKSPTNEECNLGGQAAYSNALVIDRNHTTTPATHFRTSHVPLRSQDAFISAYASARRIADELSVAHNLTIFPYSKFYIFFDQYATIVQLAATLIGSALGLILLISSILLGSLATSAVVTLTVIMIVVDVCGTMALAGVSLNAVSLVNLVICVGIGVEFCAHIARAFMFPARSMMEQAKILYRGRDARAWSALVNVGGSVFSGITITKLLGVCVLAFTRSKIFEVYYFRIWLALVGFAAVHALVFLPVALSLVGGEGYVDPESEGGLEEDLAARRYRALIPDDSDSDSDY